MSNNTRGERMSFINHTLERAAGGWSPIGHGRASSSIIFGKGFSSSQVYFSEDFLDEDCGLHTDTGRDYEERFSTEDHWVPAEEIVENPEHWYEYGWSEEDERKLSLEELAREETRLFLETAYTDYEDEDVPEQKNVEDESVGRLNVLVTTVYGCSHRVRLTVSEYLNRESRSRQINPRRRHKFNPRNEKQVAQERRNRITIRRIEADPLTGTLDLTLYKIA